VSPPPIVFDGIWKQFRRGERHTSLRDLIPAAVARFTSRRTEPRDGEFWALRDVSFEVQHGEALGIIGANGAGKSTILKLLTRILAPTRGICNVRGRIGALIETAAGFHPDLTGRENIYLQGAVAGLKRAEIGRAFDAIVDFAGIADFVDTPVKRYSSGMHARLGFSIAVHCHPDVLLVDEVLGAGDFAFQGKAFDRIKEILSSRVSAVIVSHHLDRIASLCSRAFLLDRGVPVCFGSPSECIAAYVTRRSALDSEPPSAGIQLTSLSVPPDGARSSERLCLAIGGTVREGSDIDGRLVGVRVRSAQTGHVLYAAGSDLCRLGVRSGERFEVECALQMNVAAGLYLVESEVWDTRLDRQAAQGPGAYIHVHPGRPFHGSVQMNARMRLMAAPLDPVVEQTS
jgi:ABC-type polysaccharide/polyol phosphate transport system ATPase subunit